MQIDSIDVQDQQKGIFTSTLGAPPDDGMGNLWMAEPPH